MKVVSGYPDLYCRSGTYYLCKRIPKGLEDAYSGKSHIRRSLRTKNKREAIKRLHAEQVKLDAEFAANHVKLRKTLSTTEANEIAQSYLRDLLIEDMEVRQDGDLESVSVFDQVKDQLKQAQIPHKVGYSEQEIVAEFGLSDRDVSRLREDVECIRPYYKEALAKQDLGAVSNEVDELSEVHHLELPRGSDGWKALARELLKATVQYCEIMQRRNAGELDEFISSMPPISTPERDFLHQTGEPDAYGKTRSGMTLRELVDAYKSNPGRRASERTNKSYEVLFRIMDDVIGNEKYVDEITREDFRRVRDILLKTPTNAAQRFPGKSATEVVELAKERGLNTLDPATVNVRLELMSALFKFAEQEGYVVQNLAKGLKVSEGKKAKDRRKAFTIDDLNRIFSAPLYTGCRNDQAGYAVPGPNIIKRGRYWVPLIALWTGMRLGECCQLHCSDVKEIDGVWCIVISETTDGGGMDEADKKRIKTAAGERYVPIHSELIKLGFVDFVLERQKTKDVRLFSELTASAEGYLSDNFSKWFNGENKFLGKVGVWKKHEKVFHSFRHTYRDAMTYAGLSRDVIRALGGWSSGDTEDNYGSELSAKFLKEQIEKIGFEGLVLPNLS
ncbi:DUF6538 domain-containing protein [Cohaesibacter celericrescens]|uniref:Tyr recombinase domain-containing protein n=1 Tax=Cohaesibacter celericrescens TaxID=2067669 RepID=A0A2N5XQA7_9HYPH|nr:DUF6538 domain-containing protein [Cohaesibacter celericrescens]PLW76684.1 hypothetical protein C0081_11455 [Cohaesibacter celericrescens]